LRSSSWCGGDTLEVEFSEEVVLLGHLSLSFEDLDEYTWLVVSIGGESLGLLGGDGGVSVNEVGHDSSCSLNSE